MATITKKFTVCDTCGQEGDTTPFRLGALTGNVRTVDLCEKDKAPLADLLGKVGARRRGPGRPPSVTVAEVEAIAKAEAAAKAPRKRAARKVASKVKA